MPRPTIPIILMAGLLLAQIGPVACQSTHQVKFYVFGSMDCPFCRDLRERLTGNYGEGAVIFREVNEPENGEKLAALYSIIYPEKRDIGVPLTIIVIDEEPAGSVIGAMPDDFWKDMTEECLRTGKFVIFDGGALYVAEKDPHITKRISEIIGLSSSTNNTPAAPSPSANTTSSVASNKTHTSQATLTKTLEQTWMESSIKQSSAQLTNFAFMIAAALLVAILALQFKRSH